MSKYAFDMSNIELLQSLIVSAAKVGSSCSGLIFDEAGPMYQEELAYLRGVALSRLDGQAPPFRRGDKVTLMGVSRAYSKDLCGHSTSKVIEGDGLYTVYRMWYFGGEKWKVSFNRETDLYDAEYFNLVSKAGDEPGT